MAWVTGVVLAAGAGSRMGGPKAEIVLDGQRLVDRAVAALRGCDDVLAVVRAGVLVPDARVVVNPDPDRGLRSSLELALAATTESDALAVLLVDTPGISAADVWPVVRQWRKHGGIAVASYDSLRGHPIVMSAELWRAAVGLAAPDEGARALLAARNDLVVAVPVHGDPSDLDNPDDLTDWTARS